MIENKIPTIAVINSKGGAGKTTLVTNLASFFVGQNRPTTIIDYDPQGSSYRWLQGRPDTAAPIFNINLTALNQTGHFSRSWRFHVPKDSKRIILDTPAGLDGTLLDDVIQRSDVLVVPVVPSAHDVRATAQFIAKLLFNTHYRRHKPKLCVVANRVDKGTLAFGRLQRFLASLDIPFVATFSNNRYYLQAAEKGLGIVEIATRLNEEEVHEWKKFVAWLDESCRESMDVSQKSYLSNANTHMSPSGMNTARMNTKPASTQTLNSLKLASESRTHAVPSVPVHSGISANIGKKPDLSQSPLRSVSRTASTQSQQPPIRAVHSSVPTQSSSGIFQQRPKEGQRARFAGSELKAPDNKPRHTP